MTMVEVVTCGFCGHETRWSEDNELEKLVYNVNHIIDCEEAPAEIKADAIIMLESMRAS